MSKTRGSEIKKGIGIDCNNRIRFLVGAGLLPFSISALSGCATTYPAFQQGNKSMAKFEADRQHCKLQASQALAAADARLEQFEDGSQGQLIGAGLASMISGSREESRIYKECMMGLGYLRFDG